MQTVNQVERRIGLKARSHPGYAAQPFDRDFVLSVIRDRRRWRLETILLMNPIDDRRLLGAVIWAAIWLIALQFGAAPAQAHPGHAHEAAAIAAPATVPTSIETIAVAADAEISAATEPRTASEVPSGRAIAGVQSNKMIADVPTEPVGQGALPNGTCSGACCGAAACCGTALPVEPPAHAPPHLLAQRVFRPESPAISGVDPGRLPEPPRSFA